MEKAEQSVQVQPIAARPPVEWQIASVTSDNATVTVVFPKSAYTQEVPAENVPNISETEQSY